jgi:hypothetical protein
VSAERAVVSFVFVLLSFFVGSFFCPFLFLFCSFFVLFRHFLLLLLQKVLSSPIFSYLLLASLPLSSPPSTAQAGGAGAGQGKEAARRGAVAGRGEERFDILSFFFFFFLSRPTHTPPPSS